MLKQWGKEHLRNTVYNNKRGSKRDKKNVKSQKDDEILYGFRNGQIVLIEELNAKPKKAKKKNNQLDGRSMIVDVFECTACFRFTNDFLTHGMAHYCSVE